MRNWQSIETAPKDGRLVMVKGGKGPYGVTRWEGVVMWGVPRNWPKRDATWLSPSGAVMRHAGYYPTHWMPIPDRPIEREATKGS